MLVFALILVGLLGNTISVSQGSPASRYTLTGSGTALDSVMLTNVQSASGTTSSSNQITLSNFNSGSESNQLLVVGINANNNNAVSVTFNGTPLARVASSFYYSDAEFWYLNNPSGTGNITVTFTGQTQAVVGAYSFTNVNQISPIVGHVAVHSMLASSPSVSITTQYPNDLVLDLPVTKGGETFSSPTCTQQWEINVPGTITSASSWTSVSTPSTVSCGWTLSGGGGLWDDVAIEIKPASSLQIKDIDEFSRSGGTQTGGEIQSSLIESVNVTPNFQDQIQFQYIVPTTSNNNLGMSHCSDVRLHVILDGSEVQVTGWLGYQGRQPPLPLDTGVITINSVASGQHTLTLQPEGRISGCNINGYIFSWGGLAYIFDNIR